MKEYNKLIREIEKMDDFSITKSGRRNTIKVTHNVSKLLYSVHPGENAVKPLRKWIQKQREK